jgi:hypothetical protein
LANSGENIVATIARRMNSLRIVFLRASLKM